MSDGAAPAVTVVIPTYKAAGFLPDAVASVRAQTYAPTEILVVDDASPDDTAAVAAALGVRVVRQPANAGPSAARNRAVALAEGEIVAFLDADDAWLPWHLELAVGALRANPAAALVCTAAVEWDGPPVTRPVDPLVEFPADPVVALLRSPFVPQSAAVVRRAVVAEAGWYDESIRHAEDYDLWLRIAERHAVIRIHAPGVRRRPHPGQASHATRKMVGNAFALRRRAYLAIAATADAVRTRAAEDAVGVALDADLHATWYLRDGASFDYLLSVAGEVPRTDALCRRWRLRRRWLWRAWHALRDAKRRVRPSSRPA